METTDKLAALRAELKVQNIDGFIVPRADEYQGEFVAPYAERLKWITGFTGSGGVAAILMDKACALTDGRYLIQIAQQVDQKHFETGDMISEPIEEWLRANASADAVIGYDPWLHTPYQVEKWQMSGLSFKALDSNPIDAVWQNQPVRPEGDIEIFPESIAGESFHQKKKRIANKIAEKGAGACILTLPDSISWLLNVRGRDIDYIPSLLSYAVVYADNTKPITLVVSPDRLTQPLIDHFSGGVSCIAPEHIDRIFDDLERSGETAPVMMDFARSPIWFKDALEAKSFEIKDAIDPCIAPKARKTASETAALKQAHIVDAAAMCKFLYWLEAEVENGRPVTELSASKKLQEFRAQHSAYQGDSFPSIAGFAEHGAIVHYRATEQSNIPIEKGNLFLLDSGAQYWGEGFAGTTDITRTIAIGTPDDEMRRRFTQVLKGHIAVANAKFPVGTKGVQIDALARAPLWADNVDFAHGTGHGVGCYLAVHEEAASISPRGREAFEQGMLISNEPGYYKEGAFGIRTENLVLVVGEKGVCDGTGREMMGFETISFAPIDKDAIEADMLSHEEKEWLNSYHRQVYDIVSPLLDEPHQKWLQDKTAEIK